MQGLPGISNLIVANRQAPEIFLMGFQKCGTTSVFNHLAALDHIAGPMRKEIDVLAEHNAKLSQFLYYFPKKPGKQLLNASHQTLFVPEGFRNFIKYFPAPQKVILVLRSPVKRAISHFFYDKQINLLPEDTDVETFFKEEIERAQRYYETRDTVSLFQQSSWYSSYGTPISRSIYLPYIQLLKSHGYSPYIIFIEDYQSDFEESFQSLLRYLEIELPLDKFPVAKIHNSGKMKRTVSESLQSQLEAYFRPQVAELEAFLERKTPWIL